MLIAEQLVCLPESGDPARRRRVRRCAACAGAGLLTVLLLAGYAFYVDAPHTSPAAEVATHG